MTKASDNAFPSFLVTEGSVPSSPAAGKQRLYIDSSSHLLKVVNSSGTASNVSFQQSVTEATLGGNVTMTSFGTWYDGPSMSLTGSCLVWGRIVVNPGTLSGAYAFISGRLNSGGTIVQEAETITNQGGGSVEVVVFGYLTGLSATTVKIQAMDANNNNATILRDIQNGSSTTHTASYLMALRIA